MHDGRKPRGKFESRVVFLKSLRKEWTDRLLQELVLGSKVFGICLCSFKQVEKDKAGSRHAVNIR